MLWQSEKKTFAMGPAFPTYAACEQEMIAKIKDRKKPMQDGKTNVQGNAVITEGEGRLVCDVFPLLPRHRGTARAEGKVAVPGAVIA